jgi:hypothetical protein
MMFVAASAFSVTPLPGNGAVADGGFQVTILGTPLSADADGVVPITLIAGETHLIEVSKIPGTNETQPFRGFLLRVDGGIENIDTADAFSGNFYENSKLSDMCSAQGVGGLTHKSNAAVNVSGSNFIIDQPATAIMLDVTIVVRLCNENSPLAQAPNDNVTACNPAESIYYYSAFKINVMAPAPTESPSTTPTSHTGALHDDRWLTTMLLPLVASLLAFSTFCL